MARPTRAFTFRSARGRRSQSLSLTKASPTFCPAPEKPRPATVNRRPLLPFHPQKMAADLIQDLLGLLQGGTRRQHGLDEHDALVLLGEIGGGQALEKNTRAATITR